MTADATAALDRAFRAEWAAVVAALARRLGGDVGAAEDAAQEAFADAARAWPRDGVPERPGAWLTTVARRRALDRLRRERAGAARLAALAAEPPPAAPDEEHPLPDDRLLLAFTCCHPALALESRVALTLRAVAGLRTRQIARVLLVPEAAMAQRLVRARHKVAKAGIGFRAPPPEELPERLASVLHVVYLTFTAGYAERAGGDLCAEAIRLGRLLAVLLPDDAEVLGLLALMLLHDARRPARRDARGAYVPLAEQEAARLDAAQRAEGERVLDRALRLRAPGPYQLQAAIAALHTAGGERDWPQIAALYAELHRRLPSPVIAVNRAVAIAMAGDPGAALRLLDAAAADPRLAGYQPLHAARAEVLRRTGDHAAADAALDRAIALSDDAAERAWLAERRAAAKWGRPDRD